MIVLLALQRMVHLPQLLPRSSGLEAAFCFNAAGSLIACMMEDRRATRDELFAAGATFTLLAWAFTHLFILIQALHPVSFAAACNAAAPRTWTELNYLSFALLSSTGIGDVIPLTVHARTGQRGKVGWPDVFGHSRGALDRLYLAAAPVIGFVWPPCRNGIASCVGFF